jgi:hypothetical protein
MNGSDRQVAAVAAEQFGVFSRRQAAAEGLSEAAMSRRAMSGRWEIVFPGVYRLPGTTRTGRQRAMAAVLWGGASAAVSHTTAARLLRLEGTRSPELHLTLPNTFGRRPHDFVLHRVTALPSGDLVVVDGIRCTSATRTIIDCGALLPDEALETAFEHARRMGLSSAAALARRAEELCGRGRPGSTRIRRLVALQQGGDRPLESRLEVRMARLLRRSGLPTPKRQHVVGRFRLDFAWPGRNVACECDGFEHHGHRLAWKRDRARLAALEAGRTLDRIAIALGRTERAA